MKAKFMVLAAAALVMAGCTQKEVISVPEGDSIKFSSFVGYPTKAVNDLNEEVNFTNFYIFGTYDNGDGTYVDIYDNSTATKGGDGWSYDTQYWVPGKNYVFAAYSDGNAKLDNAEFNQQTGELTIPEYTVADKDLIYVDERTATGPQTGTPAQPVELTFNHMLAKVKFTFTSAFAENLTVTVSDLKIVGSYTKGSYDDAWTGIEKGEIAYAEFNAATGEGTASEECYVMPQANNAEGLGATFTVTVTDGTNTIAEKEVTTPISLVSLDNAWKAGYVYNYTATFNDTNVEPEAEPIEFTVSVNDWEDDLNGDSQENDDIDLNL